MSCESHLLRATLTSQLTLSIGGRHLRVSVSVCGSLEVAIASFLVHPLNATISRDVAARMMYHCDQSVHPLLVHNWITRLPGVGCS